MQVLCLKNHETSKNHPSDSLRRGKKMIPEEKASQSIQHQPAKREYQEHSKKKEKGNNNNNKVAEHQLYSKRCDARATIQSNDANVKIEHSTQRNTKQKKDQKDPCKNSQMKNNKKLDNYSNPSLGIDYEIGCYFYNFNTDIWFQPSITNNELFLIQ
ncbi:hypothetical protein RFI_21839 [Reticulomyxa filosa]|uniref:Uncharacterized protein n=1 Tax=Reticulomyxa filosa TaxID=46433 RepID=X6MNE7_RETFI|nr:hypothetical protein RFI_21839 [Reticulomyxa filosa]|eukprot:ETO15523.1 hypothetical protein RFI_21839 [Reticulomyxa filosa]